MEEKLGNGINSAGLVRNYGMQLVKTAWTAFLDDDDTLSPIFIETFYKEFDDYPDNDVIIFRMQMDERIIPKTRTTNFELCDVGISFVLRSQIHLENGLHFIPDGAEDYLYLDLIRKNGYNMMISPHIMYFVKDCAQDNKCLGNRVFINNYNSNLLLFWLQYKIFINSK